MARTFGEIDLVGRSRTMLGQAVDRGTGLLADRIEHYTNLARDVSDVLRERGEPQAANVIADVSSRGTSIARYLRNSDGARIWSDAQLYAQDKSWLFGGVGLLAGMAVARTVRTAAQGGAQDERAYGDAYAPSGGST